MPKPSDLPPPRLDAAAANEAIRDYVRQHGDRPWGEQERAELHRLRTRWLQAVCDGVEPVDQGADETVETAV